jgi:type II secretion system protein N
VRKLVRIVVFFAGALVALAAVVLLGMNLYVQSQGTQARIQQEIRRHFGGELKIARVSVTPWGGLKLSGITVPQTDQPNTGNFLEAQTVGLQLRFLSLFSRRPVITEIALVDPKVTWQQNGEGKWKLPGLRERQAPAAPEDEVSSAPEEVAPPPSGTPATEPAVASPPVAKTPRQTFTAEIRHLNIRHGNFRFVDRANRLVAAFENVGMRSVLRGPASLRGRAAVQRISLRDRFFVQQLTTPLRYESGELELAQIAARIGDGQLNGHFSLESETQDSPFSVEATFKNVEADRLITEAGGPSGTLQGKLEGNFQAKGKTADADALAGSGEIVLHEGQVRQYPLLVAVGQMLQIEELMQLRLDQAVAKYRVTPGVVNVDQLDLRSANIHLSATGTITFSGKLRLDSKLSVNENLYGRLYKPIRVNFQPTNEPGFYGVNFQITGTIERPKNNLLEKAVGSGLKDLLNNIWRGKSERPKKKKSSEASPAEAASPSPRAQAISPAPSP